MQLTIRKEPYQDKEAFSLPSALYTLDNQGFWKSYPRSSRLYDYAPNSSHDSSHAGRRLHVHAVLGGVENMENDEKQLSQETSKGGMLA